MAGSLVARLARDVAPHNEVLYGPLDTVFVKGFCLWEGNRSLLGYWDDKLTEDELDLTCGVYKVATGMNSFFKQILILTNNKANVMFMVHKQLTFLGGQNL
jgi:hypothetical protein